MEWSATQNRDVGAFASVTTQPGQAAIHTRLITGAAASSQTAVREREQTRMPKTSPIGCAVALICSTAAFAACLPVAAYAEIPKGPCTVSKQVDVPARMRDGVTLMADVYRPTEPGTYPVILMRLPYNKSLAQTYVYASPEYYASQCYVVAIQDVRGQYASQGTFYAFRNEMNDGYDSVEWAASLPGSNGKVGMYGFSYVGATQWLAAVMRPPHLVAISPAMTSSDYYDGWSYEGGAWSLAFEESWPIHTIALVSARRTGDQSTVAKINEATGMLSKTYEYLPLKSYPWLLPGEPAVAGYFYDWLAHDTWDNYWQQWSIRTRYGQVQVPALNFDGWYDVFLNGAIENYVGMRKEGDSDFARTGGRLVIGPYMHLPWTRKAVDTDFGPEADNRIEQLQVAWFDHWLKGKENGEDRAPPVRVFVMGANRWRDAADWPIPDTQFTPYYLHSLGSANSLGGNGRISVEKPAADEPPDHYVYDPANPVPSRGGHSCCTPDVAPVGPSNQADVEARADVLVYSTPALDHAVEVTGPVHLTLYAASTAVDTDWTAKLVDVFPDGHAINLNNGINRARFRESLEHPSPITPGQIYAYVIDVWPTSNVFLPGHKIRLEVSSSNFPHYDRNPNTGHPFGIDAAMQPAQQTVYHDAQHASFLTLPIIPEPMQPLSAK
jgi:putative CocE/NonD family hydrolase